MGETTGALPDAAFIQELRRALVHLYSPTELRRSPMLAVFALDRQEGPAALRRILTEAVQALKPRSSMSPQSSAWRAYRTLSERYIDQFSQREVAAGLGLSIRQMKRQESMALRVLAEHLYTRHGLQFSALSQEDRLSSGPGEPPQSDGQPSSHQQEMQWLERSFPNEAADVGALLQSLLRVVAPLAQALGVGVECSLPEGLPHLAVQQASLRQALLSILTAAIRAVPRGRVSVEAGATSHEVCIHIRPFEGQSPAPVSQVDDLEMARQLVGLSGGSLEVLPGSGAGCPFTAGLTLPAAEQAAVLVIDDNVDTLQLFQRYLAGSRYPFIGARDPQQALQMAVELAPKIIILDVMLPGVDGWEVLERLREHPRTRQIPIVICTILAQEQLALSLGAATFLPKPVSRPALLAALDRLLAPPSPECPPAP